MSEYKGVKKPNKLLNSPSGFSQISPSVLAVQGLAFRPAISALSRYAQNPESLGSPGNHCSVLAVKGDVSSHPQYETLIFLRPTHGVSLCMREYNLTTVHSRARFVKVTETQIWHKACVNVFKLLLTAGVISCYHLMSINNLIMDISVKIKTAHKL